MLGSTELTRGASEKLPPVSSPGRGLHAVISEPLFSRTPPNRVESDPALIDDFVQLLTKPPYYLARELILLSLEVDHADMLCDAIVNLFLATENFFDLLGTLIALEIEELGEFSEATIFQKNSPVAVILLSIFRRTCSDYRKNLLQEKILYLLSPEQANVDLDIEQTGRKLSHVIKRFDTEMEDLVNIFNSPGAQIPRIAQQQLYVLSSTVETHLPGYGIEAATSVFFFYFIYPAVAHPDNWISNISDSFSRRKRRELSSLGKTLLYLATKSEPLNSMNAINIALTEERQQIIRKFMERLTTQPEAPQGNSFHALGIRNSGSALNESARTIKQFTGDHMSVLWRRIIRYPEIARGFFPFIRSGFDNLCNKIKSDK